MSPRTSLGASALGRPKGWLVGSAWIVVALSAGLAPAQERYRPLETGGLSAETAALLISGQEGGSIPLYAVAVPALARRGAKAPVEVFVEAEGRALLAGHQEETLRIELCLYALAGSRVADSSLETVELVLARDRQLLLSGGIKLRSTLELAAGDYRLRILARNVQTGELGLRSFAVSVPAADVESVVLPLLAADSPASWLRLTRSTEPPVTGFWPSARPLLAPDRDTELQVLVRGIEPDAARLEIAGARGETLALSAAVSPADESAASGLGRWSVRTHIPSLQPGDYELRLRVADIATSPVLPVVVHPGGAGSWARQAAEASGAAVWRTESPVGQRGDGRPDAAILRTRYEGEYRRALGRLAATDTLGALAELSRLESEAFEPTGDPGAMAAAEQRIGRALAKAEAISLTPLFELHYRAYRRYLEQGRYKLSSHARERLLALVDLYLAQRPEDTSAAVRVLVALANQLQRSQMARFSSVIFHRALEIDPQNEGALLGLAVGLEKRGAYTQVVGFLERLVAAHPENHEAWLRLAVNLARTGSRAKARRLLARLLGSEPADWILAVAYHELARDLVDRDRPAEAQMLIEAARARLPGDDQLELLSSVAAEAQPHGETSAGDELVLSSRADEPSARHRYQMWPQLVPNRDQSPGLEPLAALAATLEGLPDQA